MGYRGLPDIEYQNYNLINHHIDYSWEHYDHDELKKETQKGFREIDLNLTNYAGVRNLKKVEELLHMGADPYIDPEGNSESEVLNILSADESYHFIEYINCYEIVYNNQDMVMYRGKLYEMLGELWATASSAAIYEKIKNFGTEHLKY